MEQRELNAESLSGRQLAVTAMVAGLSPAAYYAGRAPWFWVLLWCGVVVLAAVPVHLYIRKRRGGELSIPVRVLYALWAVILAARVLSRTVERLEQTSGGSPRFWLLVIVTVPLLIVGWGRTAPFFRMTEILWLAMAAVLVLVLVLGVGRIELRYLAVGTADWRSAVWVAGEVFAPVLFVLPYIYKGDGGGDVGCFGWMAALGGVAAAMFLLTAGILGAAGTVVPQAFYVAAGGVGESARGEGALSVLWLLPDLVCAGLLCRSWGSRWWPALGALLAAGLSLTALPEFFLPQICVIGSLVLLGVTLISGGKG